MRTVYEAIVDILAAIRSAIARELAESHGMNQGQIAETMAVSQPAVSQYLNNIRGKSNPVWLRSPVVDKIIKESCYRLARKESDIFTEISKITRELREKKIICPSCGSKGEFCGKCMEI